MRSNKVIKVSSVEEADKIIYYNHIQKNINRNVITKLKFDINGETYSLNPSKIKKIEAKFESKIQEMEPSRESRMFKLFKRDSTPTNVVINTGFTPDEVALTYTKFLEFKGTKEIPKRTENLLFSIMHEFEGGVRTYEEFIEVFKMIVEAALNYYQFKVTCRYCGGVIQLTAAEWPLIEKSVFKLGLHHRSCP
ncbi:MAG: hypothetical protein IH814_01830 [Thaumarchaeota archaeon]|nr:hypothetical protein [Nitrososphaerota archaeon]